ncbi:MBL fold metallo-hydrolase [Xanthovirga aplysinae]|uniref:MBL fold metallo-hydrolase n=1 Tax=Xanthovirga aplysinae TaxID=2529853 RepID=UPI0012BB6BE2|nr:MBL fold metallo-hydrolase [Xanthovirga aplysinae]MTI32185.1 MBL fold metallo-hydrolase [Xanthovirga aplysinae]
MKQLKTNSRSFFAAIALMVAFLYGSTVAFAQEPIWDANKIVLTKKKLAPGVFGVFPKESFDAPASAPKPTSGGFIIGEKGVLIIDSFLNGDLAAQLIALIRQETELPIKYVVNTSYHGDHSYGNFVFPSETAIVQHQGTVDYINAYFEPDRKWMIGNFGEGRGMEKVMPRDADIIIQQGDQLTIDLGGKKVTIYTFGFGQTPGDLYIWEPNSKTMWVGNVWVAGKPGLPWLLDGRHEEVAATMKKVRDFLPADATIVPGHHLPMKKADLDFKIDYLEELHNQVEKAVKKGWSLEKTKEKVKMDNFRGYAMFDWVHFDVNIPKTYEELSKKN